MSNTGQPSASYSAGATDIFGDETGGASHSAGAARGPGDEQEQRDPGLDEDEEEEEEGEDGQAGDMLHDEDASNQLEHDVYGACAKRRTAQQACHGQRPLTNILSLFLSRLCHCRIGVTFGKWNRLSDLDQLVLLLARTRVLCRGQRRLYRGRLQPDRSQCPRSVLQGGTGDDP